MSGDFPRNDIGQLERTVMQVSEDCISGASRDEILRVLADILNPSALEKFLRAPIEVPAKDSKIEIKFIAEDTLFNIPLAIELPSTVNRML